MKSCRKLCVCGLILAATKQLYKCIFRHTARLSVTLCSSPDHNSKPISRIAPNFLLLLLDLTWQPINFEVDMPKFKPTRSNHGH